jgi:capsular polysaccharide biosynthesis protein
MNGTNSTSALRAAGVFDPGRYRMDARRYLTLARRSWWLFLLGALFALASYGVTLRIRGDEESPDVYHSNATIFVETGATGGFFSAPGSPQAGDLGRLTASYAEMVEGRLVAERLAAFLRRPGEAGAMRARIDARAVPGTQIIRITSTGRSAEDADVLAAGTANTFIALHQEKGLPGMLSLYETSPATLEPKPAEGSPLPIYALVVVAGTLATAVVLFAWETQAERINAAAARISRPPSVEPSPAPKPARAARPRPAPQVDAVVADPDTAA